MTKINVPRILAILVILVAITYFYFYLFAPKLIPTSLLVGVVRRPINLLILGTDVTYDRITLKPMEDHEGRADTILLAHINPIKDQVNILSIPRDTYLTIPGYGMQRANFSNAYGGVNSVIEMVSNFTGQKVDYYVKVKPTAVTKLIDLLGGIEIDVAEDMKYTDNAQGLNINLKAGKQHLSGKAAHDYIRYRDKFSGDIGRIGRHQKFFKAVSQSFTKPTNVIKAPYAIYISIQEMQTNLPLAKTIRLLNWSRLLSSSNIRSSMVPGDVDTLEKFGSVWVPNHEKLTALIKDYFKN